MVNPKEQRLPRLPRAKTADIFGVAVPAVVPNGRHWVSLVGSIAR